MRERLVGFLVLAGVGLGASAPLSAGNPPLLLRHPTVSKTHLVFTYGDDLWIVDRAATRGTSPPAWARRPTPASLRMGR